MKIDPRKNYYSVLGVAEKATTDEIRRAYRKKAIETHPDKNPNDPKANDKFNAVSEAYGVLSDAASRQKYNEMRTSGTGAGQAWSRPRYSDLDQMFSGVIAQSIRARFNNAARKVVSLSELQQQMEKHKKRNLFSVFLPKSLLSINVAKTGVNLNALNPDGTTGVWSKDNQVFISAQTLCFIWLMRHPSLTALVFNAQAERIFNSAVNSCNDHRTKVPLMKEVVNAPF